MRLSIIPLAVVFLLPACAMHGQQTMATLKQFRNFGAGQYQQTSQAYRDGQPFGQPVIDTHCAAPLTPQGMDYAKQVQAMAGPSCSTKVTIDTPKLAEWVETCNPGAMQSVIHSTFKRVDDRTLTMDTAMSMGGIEGTSTHTTLKYLGVCPAGMAPPAAPQIPAMGMPKLSAESCAQMPEMRQQAKEASAESCRGADFPPAMVARCEAAMKIMKDQVQQLEVMCKR